MMKYIFYLSLFLTFTTVEVKAGLTSVSLDAAVRDIKALFTDQGGETQDLSEDDFNNFKTKVEECMTQINDSDLTAKVEKVFNDAKKKVNNVVKDVDLNDIKNQVDKLLQDAKEAGIDWNSSTSLKFSSVTVVMILFSAYVIA